jgi:hypothetical protein
VEPEGPDGGGVMEDKAIGELWRRHDEPAHEYSCVEVRALIRKLVEERAQRYCQLPVGEPAFESSYKYALLDFGIDSETWKE